MFLWRPVQTNSIKKINRNHKRKHNPVRSFIYNTGQWDVMEDDW